MIKHFIYIIVLMLLSVCLNAQNIDYARNILLNLCSNNFYGRAYSFAGDSIANSFIAKEFENIGLKKFNNSYFQPFVISTNVFDNRAFVVIDSDTLVAGKDFVVMPSSKSICSIRKILNFNPLKKASIKMLKYCLNNADSNYVIVFDTVGVNKQFIDKYYSIICGFNQKISHVELKFVNKLPPQGIATMQSNYSSFYVLDKWFNNKKIQLVLDATLKLNYTTNNLIGYLQGLTDSCFVITAHYDHVGTLGKNTYFPGAHDNASGVAMLLDLAQYFANNKFRYSIVFIAFSGEEAGLLGSRYFVRHPLFDLQKIKALVNLDMLGSGDEGIMVVNGSVFNDIYNLLVNINNTKHYLPKIDKRGEAANSDHYFFYKAGVKSIYIYTLGKYKEYHNIYDTSDNVSMPMYDGIFNLVKDFITEF